MRRHDCATPSLRTAGYVSVYPGVNSCCSLGRVWQGIQHVQRICLRSCQMCC
jgi:hypothetical protein